MGAGEETAGEGGAGGGGRSATRLRLACAHVLRSRPRTRVHSGSRGGLRRRQHKRWGRRGARGHVRRHLVAQEGHHARVKGPGGDALHPRARRRRVPAEVVRFAVRGAVVVACDAVGGRVGRHLRQRAEAGLGVLVEAQTGHGKDLEGRGQRDGARSAHLTSLAALCTSTCPCLPSLQSILARADRAVCLLEDESVHQVFHRVGEGARGREAHARRRGERRAEGCGHLGCVGGALGGRLERSVPRTTQGRHHGRPSLVVRLERLGRVRVLCLPRVREHLGVGARHTRGRCEGDEEQGRGSRRSCWRCIGHLDSTLDEASGLH
mmetsp:Transcript_2087/g.5892  ORF Transcript_2087/g.5892 Transcript_2087/m.5892 type:complete len:322 (+) Transcript_2087:1139-2104(+)